MVVQPLLVCMHVFYMMRRACKHSSLYFSIVVITLLFVLCNNHFQLISLWTFMLPHIGNKEVLLSSNWRSLTLHIGNKEVFLSSNWRSLTPPMVNGTLLSGNRNYRCIEATLNSYQFYGTKGIQDSQEHCRSQQTNRCQF